MSDGDGVVPRRGPGAWRAGRAARPVDCRQSDLLLAPRLLDAGGGAGGEPSPVAAAAGVLKRTRDRTPSSGPVRGGRARVCAATGGSEQSVCRSRRAGNRRDAPGRRADAICGSREPGVRSAQGSLGQSVGKIDLCFPHGSRGPDPARRFSPNRLGSASPHRRRLPAPGHRSDQRQPGSGRDRDDREGSHPTIGSGLRAWRNLLQRLHQVASPAGRGGILPAGHVRRSGARSPRTGAADRAESPATNAPAAATHLDHAPPTAASGRRAGRCWGSAFISVASCRSPERLADLEHADRDRPAHPHPQSAGKPAGCHPCAARSARQQL